MVIIISQVDRLPTVICIRKLYIYVIFYMHISTITADARGRRVEITMKQSS